MPKKLFESNFWEVALSFLQVALNSLYISNYGSVYNRIKSNQQETYTQKTFVSQEEILCGNWWSIPTVVVKNNNCTKLMQFKRFTEKNWWHRKEAQDIRHQKDMGVCKSVSQWLHVYIKQMYNKHSKKTLTMRKGDILRETLFSNIINLHSHDSPYHTI